MNKQDGVLGVFKGTPIISIDNDDFGCILNCAVRYSLGRQTYMPHTVIGFAKPLLPHITKRTLVCMERDIREAENFGAGYGSETIDKPAWLNFLKEVQDELTRRENT